ncbi:MAG: SAM-dependent methyltransferase [Gammaproteobacteria bacterium]|nr:SAM-dependent methyltransferase [Gammaproteobacteria bacterium]MBV8405381.1 SAM-dependent methyltransferase [Gammaproteobacteria bacterium]
MLPPLDAQQRAHSERLAALVRAQLIEAGGWLSFERFMDLALYAPGLGYYSAGSAKLGPGGDFVTAPELSDLFSRCIARQCAAVLEATGGEILELGAGTGRLAAAVLSELAALDRLPGRYAILEVSADLAQRQRAHIARLPEALRQRITWLERLPEQPVRGVMLANEVADALPCRRFRREGTGINELGVALADGEPHRFVEKERAPDASLARAYAELLRDLPDPLPVGYTSELCLRADAWIASLAACLDRGLLLLCDYGLPRRHYYHPQRTGGTLRCHYRQLAHDDPFINLGVQDITAWVDFTRIAAAGHSAGLEVQGFATQAAFLLGCGIEELVLESGEGIEHARRAAEARRLLMPEEMGEAFKVMALARDLDIPLAGFVLQDLRHLL